MLLLYRGNNDEIILDIKDTGIGIGEGSLKKIFEPFRQEQMGYGRAYDGIGLGLSLVEKVLFLNNAKVMVESKKEEGTTFSINFGDNAKVGCMASINNII
jgi:signal transduction histidine kinase